MESFQNIPDWINEVTKYTAEDTLKVLLVNKCDVNEKERQISKEVFDKFTEETGIQVIETSAKTGLNVDEAFIQLTKKLIEKKGEQEEVRDKKTLGGARSGGEGFGGGCCT